MDRSLVLDGARRDYQHHLKLGHLDLEGFVGELAAAASGALTRAGLASSPATLPLLRDSLRQSLRKYVVGRDVCGLSAFCRLAEEFDPWEDGDSGG